MRVVGGESSWGSAEWGSGSWGLATADSDLAALCALDPDPSAGVSVGSRASGGLRFVVELQNPTQSGNAPAAQWGVAQWGSASWAADAGTWQDITARVRGLSWAQGQHDALNRYEAATASVTLDNRDGALCPWATTGAFTSAGESWLVAGLVIRWGVLCTSALDGTLPPLDAYTPLLTGRLELVQEGTQDNVDAWVTLNVVDTWTDLASTADPVTLAPQDLARAIFATALAGGWKFQQGTIEVPDDTVDILGVTLTGNSTIERLQLLADCRHWDVITDGRGRIKVIPRKTVDGAQPGVPLVFSNDPTGTELPLVTPEPFSSTDRVLNVATASRTSGTPQTARSSASISKYGGELTNRFGFPRTDLPLADADVLALCQKVVRLRARDAIGISAISLNSDQDLVKMIPVLTYLASTARGAIPFGVRWVHPSLKELAMNLLSEGQTHNVTMEGTTLLWTATINTTSAA